MNDSGNFYTKIGHTLVNLRTFLWKFSVFFFWKHFKNVTCFYHLILQEMDFTKLKPHTLLEVVQQKISILPLQIFSSLGLTLFAVKNYRRFEYTLWLLSVKNVSFNCQFCVKKLFSLSAFLTKTFGKEIKCSKDNGWCDLQRCMCFSQWKRMCVSNLMTARLTLHHRCKFIFCNHSLQERNSTNLPSTQTVLRGGIPPDDTLYSLGGERQWLLLYSSR